MNIVQTRSFEKVVKKLHANQKLDLDLAIKSIAENPNLGEEKVGDLAKVRVHKFKMVKQLMLLAYQCEDQTVTLILLALGSHENFYRDLKKSN
jgi:mRNA-degrading endonuclease RelE of RelBE toxin-antitoxin system